MEGGRVFICHHGHSLFALPNLARTTCADPSNWVYDDDIDVESDEKQAQPQGGDVSGGVSGVRMKDVVGSSGAVPHDEVMLDPLMTRSRAAVSSSGFDVTHFY